MALLNNSQSEPQNSPRARVKNLSSRRSSTGSPEVLKAIESLKARITKLEKTAGRSDRTALAGMKTELTKLEQAPNSPARPAADPAAHEDPEKHEADFWA